MLGLTYMLQFKEIKKKHLGYFYARLPSLHVLDAMNSRAVVVGWLFLTIGVVVGVVWAAQARAVAPGNSNLQAMSLNDPKILIAVVTWAVYSFEVRGAIDDGMDRPARSVALGARLRDRAAELPSGQLFRQDEPHVPVMHLFLLGVSHKTAPVDVRERLDFSSRDLGAAVEALATRPSAAESVVLSTCNRSEIYVASDDPELAREDVVAFLSHYHSLPRRELCCRTSSRSATRRPRSICSASPRVSTRSSSASRRSSGR